MGCTPDNQFRNGLLATWWFGGFGADADIALCSCRDASRFGGPSPKSRSLNEQAYWY